ncbi:hypothetical protein ABKU80_03355 [Enterobacter mori]|jgi:hypothetical protein|uniref:hypothetical protein n=1 Tax=Enterobacter mori TaxID=539813 RepID=UPI0032AF1A43
MMKKLTIAVMLFGAGVCSSVHAEYTDCNILLSPVNQDYGRIHKDELNFTSTDKGQAAELRKRQVQLTVTCPEKEIFDLTFLGNMTENSDLAFSDKGKVVLTVTSLSADSGNVFIKRTSGKTVSTEPVSALRIYMGDRIKPVDASGLPLAVRSLNATLEIAPWLGQNTYRDLADDKKIESPLTVRIEQSE